MVDFISDANIVATLPDQFAPYEGVSSEILFTHYLYSIIYIYIYIYLLYISIYIDTSKMSNK